MLKLGELNVLIKGDNKPLDKSIDESERKVADGASRMSLSLGSIAKAAVAAWAAVGAANQVRDAIRAASDLQQSVGGVDAVFKQSAAGMHAWAKAAADSFGLSENEANQFAAVLGSQLKNAGQPLDQVADKTKALVKLGSDLAATYGGTTADAVDAISAALKGEMDPIEKYGISLNQALLQQQALGMGLSKDTTKWTLAQKQQIILAALYRQSGDAAGQFAAQSDTLAETQQRTNAKWENAKAALAESLLPALSAGTDLLGDMANWLQQNHEWAVPVGVALGGILATIYLIVTATKAWTAAQIALSIAMDASPIGLVSLAVLAIVAGVALLVEGLRRAGVTWSDFANAGKAAVNGIVWALNKIIDAYDWIFDKINKIPHPGLPDLPHIPHIPSLAEGGVVPATPGGRIVRVAEAGEPEIVSPEGKLQRLVAAAVSSSMAQLSATQGDLYLALYIGDEPVRAIARAEVTDQARRTADWVRVARAGTGRLR